MSRSATDRSYLSIREVLDLLVEEFPDVTISKIRFLESRGLIHPERTPSGYRKFYEADVERLRWILRQQREHFLPLKVIKGRLEGNGEQQNRTPSLFDDDADAPEERDAPPEADESAAVAETENDVAEPVEPAAEHAAGETARRTRRARNGARSKAVEVEVEEIAAEAVPAPGAGREATGPQLSADDLARAAGTDLALVGELERFGLIEGRDVAGTRCYGEEALLVAQAAAGFDRFGLEPRHLRTIMHAAEREASLYSQVVMPLLRQRNPAARTKAHADLAELAGLGAALREVLVRAELRRLTGG